MGEAVEWVEWLDAKRGVVKWRDGFSISHFQEFFREFTINGAPVAVQWKQAPLSVWLREYAYGTQDGRIVSGVSEAYLAKNCVGGEKIYLAAEINGWLSQGLDARWELHPQTIDERLFYVTTIASEEVKDNFQFKLVTECWRWLPVGEFFKNKIISEQNAENFYYDPTLHPKALSVFELENQKYSCADAATLFVENEKFQINYDHYLASLSSTAFLGAHVEDQKTFFGLFAPQARIVEVLWKVSLGAEWNTFPMECNSEEGTWSAVIEKDLSEQYYMYRVTRIQGSAAVTTDVVDPYAQALVQREGPGIIVNSQKVDGIYPHRSAPEELVIYECHVRDMTAKVTSITPEDRLHFSGLCQLIENGYFESLGINALELQPIQEFDNEKPEGYHWGYMPVNYFSPASAYASCPERASQIEEFKKLVETCHRHGLSVILDVVYNHVGNPNHLYAIDDRYYFRQKSGDGTLENFSGCGNDLKTENPMVRRLILDSLQHWIEMYDVDGFRFDLAELIGLPFLEEAREKLQQLKPNLVMIAEPWSFRCYVGHEVKATRLQAWNDEFRNFIPQYVHGHGNREGLRYFLRGSVDFRSSFPAQSINYLASHDDYCWLDAITENANHDGSYPTMNDLRRTHMALAILLLSQGVPMFAEGIELLHSKRGVENTYQRGDHNALSYMRQNEYPLTFQYIKNLIHLRQTSRLFQKRQSLPEDYAKIFPSARNDSAAAILLKLENVSGVLLALNPHETIAEFDLQNTSWEAFQQIADTFTFGTGCAHYPLSSMILEIPPMSCGVWVETQAGKNL
ncbi:MAG: alpha-amylase family glycosyl hydrolase [Verrucomicrobiota bacterium]|nr:MAG: alpha-amylase family glycosyl hydrolase [Verrucomicrobiota bacterium]